MNTLMNELQTNDCALPESKPSTHPFGTQITHTCVEWDQILHQPHYPSFLQINKWPISCKLGLLTSRLENDWNDELTSSVDLMYMGVIPKNLSNIIRQFCDEAKMATHRPEDKPRITQLSKHLNQKWHDITHFVRIKPQAIQRVISAQLSQYKNDLKRKQQSVLEHEGGHITEEQCTPTLKNDVREMESANGNRNMAIRTCVGKGCTLNQHYKQFRVNRVNATTTNAGEKKCSQYETFEAALNKVLKIEEYLHGQLKDPTDDIIVLLRDLSLLMITSKHSYVQRSQCYDEVLRIPKIREILKEPNKATPDGKCENFLRNALNMLAATFGIALKGRIFNNPFPAISTEEAHGMWGRDVEKAQDRDTWAQIKWFITHFSITARKIQLEKLPRPTMNQEEMRILRRAEKVNKLNDFPTSITATIPRRIHGGWDLI